MNLLTEQRLARWREFYASDRSRRRMLVVNGVSGDALPLSYRMYWPENRSHHVEWALKNYALAQGRAEWMDDDEIPNLNLLSGTEIFAESFGCPVHRPEDNMPFALPAVRTAKEADALTVPSLWESPLRLQFEMADAMRKQEADALLRLPDLQSPLDIAALIWEKSDFYCALIDTPEAVHALCEKIYALLTAFLDAWFERYGCISIAHFPEYPLFGGLSISEDEIGALSAELFDEFAAPYLNRLSARYGGIGIHCCANSRHQWEGFSAVNGLRLINLVQPTRELVSAADHFAAVAQWPMGDRLDEELYDNPTMKELRFVESHNLSGLTKAQVMEWIAAWRERRACHTAATND